MNGDEVRHVHSEVRLDIDGPFVVESAQRLRDSKLAVIERRDELAEVVQRRFEDGHRDLPAVDQ
jgi:hypothetical protein